MGRCYNSIVIPQDAQQVWERIRDFHDMSWAPNVIETLETIGDKAGTVAGARRKLNGAFVETLREIDEAKRSFWYTIEEGPGPLAPGSIESYVSTLRVMPVTADGSTFVVWTAEFRTHNDNAVAEFLNPVYEALLAAMADGFAAKGAAASG